MKTVTTCEKVFAVLICACHLLVWGWLMPLAIIAAVIDSNSEEKWMWPDDHILRPLMWLREAYR